MKFILLLNGTFAAGKSTVSKILAEELDEVSICDWDTPDINDQSIIDLSERKAVRRQRLLDLCTNAMNAGRSVIIPNTITDRQIHEQLKSIALMYEVRFLHLVLMVSEDEMRRRLALREYNGSITDESTARTYHELQHLITDESLRVIDSETQSPELVSQSILISLQ